jgi:hypothetical protein
MKRSWLIDALMAACVAAAALLLLSFLNDVWALSTHFYLVPTELTGMLWNLVGLPPSPASLIGVLTHGIEDPFLSTRYKSSEFLAVLITAAALCLIQAFGLRRRQNWAFNTMVLLCAVDFLVQGSDLSRAVREQWREHVSPAGFLLADARMMLKLCLDTVCAAALLLDRYGQVSPSRAAAPARWNRVVPSARPLAAPAVLPTPAASDPWLRRPLAVAPAMRSNQIVFASALACLAVLLLLLTSKAFVPAQSMTHAVYERIFPALLLASLQYGLVAWHTRKSPERFGLGLGCACSLWVSAVGLWAAPLFVFGLLTQHQNAQAPELAGLGSMAFLVLLFLVADLVLLYSCLRTTYLAREELPRFSATWALGFALPFALLIVFRSMFRLL